MLISQPSLAAVLKSNVCEIKFLRRTVKQGRPPYRRMVCTNANNLLLSVDGRLTLNYTPPKTVPKYNVNEKNVIIAWDVLMQDFRTINCDSVNLIRSVPANQEFWDFFRKELLPMTSSQKMMYMDM
jgi:hypothetical protein